MRAQLYIFDTAAGIDGAPCVERHPNAEVRSKVARESEDGEKWTQTVWTPVDPTTVRGIATDVGVASSDHNERSIAELRLNADGVTIDIVAGYSLANETVVRDLHKNIDPAMLEGLLRCALETIIALVDGGVNPGTGKLVTLSQSSVRIARKLNQMLGNVESILDATDLADSEAVISAYKKIMADRTL